MSFLGMLVMYIDGKICTIEKKLSDQEYLACDEDGVWRILLVDDIDEVLVEGDGGGEPPTDGSGRPRPAS